MALVETPWLLAELPLFWGGVLLIGLNAVLVAGEYALVALRPSQAEEMRAAGRAGSAALLRLKADLPTAIAAVQLGITLTNLLLGSLAEPTVEAGLSALLAALPLPVELPESLLMAVSVGTAFFLVTLTTVLFGELLPKALTLKHTEHVALWTAGPLLVLVTGFRPAVVVLNGLAAGVLRLAGLGTLAAEDSVPTGDELEILVDQSLAAGKVHQHQGLILRRVFDLEDRSLSEVVIPLERTVSLHTQMGREDVLDVALMEPHTRWPVRAGPQTTDRIVGLATAKHLLCWMSVGELMTMTDLMMSISELSAQTRLHEALRVLLSTGRHMAVVVDGSGQQLGVVTLEDLLSAIVGPIPAEGLPVRSESSGRE